MTALYSFFDVAKPNGQDKFGLWSPAGGFIILSRYRRLVALKNVAGERKLNIQTGQ